MSGLWRTLSSLPFHTPTAEINSHLAKQCTCRVIWSFISAVASARVSLLSVHVFSADTKSPITAASSLFRPARLDRSYIRRTTLNFASAGPPPPPPHFLSPPPRVFPQGRLMKSSCKCNESIIKMKQLLNRVGESVLFLEWHRTSKSPVSLQERHDRVWEKFPTPENQQPAPLPNLWETVETPAEINQVSFKSLGNFFLSTLCPSVAQSRTCGLITCKTAATKPLQSLWDEKLPFAPLERVFQC